MIRRSAGLAVAALILSLFVHFLGIGLTFSPRPNQPSSDGTLETVSLGNSFDEVADLRATPVEPVPVQPVEPPDLPEETPPEPPEAEAPTSQALVASPNPQRTFAPDTGTSPPVSDAVDPSVTPEAIETPEPDPVAPSGGAETEVADARMMSPVEAEADAAPPAAGAAPAEPETAQGPDAEDTLAPVPAAPQVTAPVADVIAALPPETTPSIPEGVLAPVTPEDQESGEVPQGNTLTTSLRPPSTTREEPPQEQRGFGSVDSGESLQASRPTIESPLTLYSRDGIELFGGQRRDRRSRSGGGGLGPGNSDVTNYAGRVLVHLNRTPPVAVSARGWARVSFRINPDGTLASVNVIDGSGSTEINLAAKTQVQSGVPFPRPPGGKSRLLTFVYRPF